MAAKVNEVVPQMTDIGQRIHAIVGRIATVDGQFNEHTSAVTRSQC